jgi:hypothetical protein
MPVLSAGYSSAPLWKKLDFKPGMKVCALDAPEHYPKLIDGPNDWVMVKEAKLADALHLFIINGTGLKRIAALAKHMPPPSCSGCRGRRSLRRSRKG